MRSIICDGVGRIVDLHGHGAVVGQCCQSSHLLYYCTSFTDQFFFFLILTLTVIGHFRMNLKIDNCLIRRLHICSGVPTGMWLSVVALSVLPVLGALVFQHRGRVASICRSVFQRWRFRNTSVGSLEQRVHGFVMTNSTHGQPDSVLQTFDDFSRLEPTCSIGRERGELLDRIVTKVSPQQVLEFGTFCGYSAVRILRLLPTTGKLLTVERDPHTADVAEEMILVAGFKHSQFRLLVCSAQVAIAQLQSCYGISSVDLLVMKHNVADYLADLQTLENSRVLSYGCVLLVLKSHLPGALQFLQYVHHNASFKVVSQVMDVMEIHYLPPMTGPAL
ncbi:transmembrane O-methyltransferase homolog [Polypterus senegalus]|uniref:transmembrane O-methyltransferase homolog n=1 Tax=Polypterus senegalus TaxID=55291 RepID=UPI0019644AEF|nr:transmembrane O-methyltransferase homolog [Polypterus senegalus]